MIKKCKAWAPATIANVGVGFDILGFAIEGIGDSVTVTRTDEMRVSILSIVGMVDSELPFSATRNTATAGLIKMQKDLNLKFGFSVEIEKGIPMGSGLGGSAASAVAAIVAANQLLKKPLSREELLPFAAEGEFVASGSRHADNIAPGLFGGLVLVQQHSQNSSHKNYTEIVNIAKPQKMSVVVLHPGFCLKTKKARSVLPKKIFLKDHILASSHLAGFISGCFLNNAELIAKNLNDVLIEPYRRSLVPGFLKIKSAALNSGAWGAAMAGAGPTLFAWCDSAGAQRVCQSMLRAAQASGHKKSKCWITKISDQGAREVF